MLPLPPVTISLPDRKCVLGFSKGESVGTGVSSPVTAKRKTKTPVRSDPTYTVVDGLRRTGVFVSRLAVTGEETPVPTWGVSFPKIPTPESPPPHRPDPYGW